ncbi:hypothetical protein PYW07_012709 [Mythimna separata]|uniref:Adenosine 5'-monophosphoramidase HINT3 n=1 Tax=Mythimna separata TaxID=271217 RepID=A0AAD7Y8X3_MYTSE|nr:hypothetical protein PYW07_012709 [Mythimna separata]
MSTPAAQRSNCIFCNIVNKMENTAIVYEDKDVCVFPSIRPASKFHLLIIPKRHIEDAKRLTPNDKDLVTKMLEVAQGQLAKNNFSLCNSRLGYHWPPLRSIKHLHLHAIAPESEMGFIARFIYKKNSFWFVSPEYVASRIS